MQPLTGHRELESTGVTETKRFGISMTDQEHIKMLLRDAIYSDKIMAVLREYSANAWDAHRMVGKADLPIEVQLPTPVEPTLLIKDFGPGLSHDEAFNIFTQYGASTKRGSNQAVGMLGIGSKAGFAYSDSFMVISRYGGKCRTYAAVLNEDEEDVFSLLSEEDHDPADTGLTIQVAVRREDIAEFQRKAKDLFCYFQPRPKINIELPAQPKIAAKLTHGLVYDRTHYHWEEKKWFAVMGCVPYRIDIDQLKGPDGQSLISESFESTSGLLYFDIGGVQINASREGLKYSKMTKEALARKFEAMLEEFVKTVLDEVETGGGTDWDKRNNLQRLLVLGMGKKEIGELAEDHVRITEPETLDFERRSIPVGENTRIIRHTAQSNAYVEGYQFNHGSDVLVRPGKKLSAPNEQGLQFQTEERHPEVVAWAALEQLIQEKKMGGITVVDLHTLPWQPKPVAQPKNRKHYTKAYNPKHRVSSFRYLGYKGSKSSDNWEAVKREPQTDDVFVIIEKFEDSVYLHSKYREDQKIAEHFGLKLPEIYGYKSTQKKPVFEDAVTGIPYLEWRKKFLEVIDPSEVIQQQNWMSHASSWGALLRCRPQTTLSQIWDEFGKEHVVTTYLYKLFKAFTSKIDTELYDILVRLTVTKVPPSEPREMLEEIMATYPLLGDAGLKVFWRNNAAEWRRYVRLVDTEEKTRTLTYADIAVPPATES